MSVPANKNFIAFLNDLFNTNTDFAKAHDESYFDSFRDVQTPKVTVLKCSDSRVQMKSFATTPQNAVFAVRNIGNQLKNNEGSVDFGIRVLKTPFLLIIGHSGCGAIDAKLSGKTTNIDSIDHELANLQLQETNIKNAIIENVNNQVALAMQKYQDLIVRHELIVMGAVYDFKNDFGFGKGRLVLVNINNETNHEKATKNIASKVKNLQFLS
ncbi:MAG: carbonic anhydrase [Rickettsiaceae bacterium]|nr:carbonic anhydrase [Rickettsiaceae bacterium]